MGVRAPSLKRSLGIAAVGSSLAFAVALSACGDDGGTTQPSIIIQPSTFSTIVSTTGPPAAASAGGAPAGGTVAGTQVYEVQSNDFLSGIANDYGIPPESIANFNQWDDGLEHAIHPGDQINIPPGAQVPDPEDEEDEEDSSDDEDTQDDSEDEDAQTEETRDPDEEPRCADGSRQGTYTIEVGDIPAAVAESLDVTVDQLDEANANTAGYRVFIVGAEILVPCGDET
jgi:LysM repeat protein